MTCSGDSSGNGTIWPGDASGILYNA
jgi:hypothetical protein